MRKQTIRQSVCLRLFWVETRNFAPKLKGLFFVSPETIVSNKRFCLRHFRFETLVSRVSFPFISSISASASPMPRPRQFEQTFLSEKLSFRNISFQGRLPLHLINVGLFICLGLAMTHATACRPLSHPSGHECRSYMLNTNCLHTFSFLRFLDLVRRSCPKTTRRSPNFHSFHTSP